MITSRDNATLKLVRKLGQRKHRDETGLFVCEGEDLAEAALAAGIEPVELLVAGENVLPSCSPASPTLPHPPRVIGVYRRADLPRALRDVTPRALAACPTPATSARCSAPPMRSARASRSPTAAPTRSGRRRCARSAGAIFRVPVGSWDDAAGQRIALVAHGGEPLADVELDAAGDDRCSAPSGRASPTSL